VLEGLLTSTTDALLFENQHKSHSCHVVLRMEVLMISLFHFECRMYLESKHTSICTQTRACHAESFKCHILNIPSRSPENDFNTYADMHYKEDFRTMFCEKVLGFMTERNISRS
jgi:hypothetical protein